VRSDTANYTKKHYCFHLPEMGISQNIVAGIFSIEVKQKWEFGWYWAIK
jgi:hypothetical protein